MNLNSGMKEWWDSRMMRGYFKAVEESREILEALQLPSFFVKLGLYENMLGRRRDG
jgi:hypothetical protein